MGHVHRAFAVQVHVAGDEERVGVADHRLCSSVQAVEAFDLCAGFTRDPVHRAQLDVLGAVAEGLHHIDRKTVVVQPTDAAVHAVAAAGAEVDAQQAHGGAIAQGGPCWVAAGWQAVDLQGVRVGRVGKTRRAFNHRRPGNALLIHHAKQQIRQQGIEIPMLFGQVVTNHLGADHGHALGHANGFLHLPFAGMPGGLFARVHGNRLRVGCAKTAPSPPARE